MQVSREPSLGGVTRADVIGRRHTGLKGKRHVRRHAGIREGVTSAAVTQGVMQVSREPSLGGVTRAALGGVTGVMRCVTWGGVAPIDVRGSVTQASREALQGASRR
jgi:hypothetical protein